MFNNGLLQTHLQRRETNVSRRRVRVPELDQVVVPGEQQGSPRRQGGLHIVQPANPVQRLQHALSVLHVTLPRSICFARRLIPSRICGRELRTEVVVQQHAKIRVVPFETIGTERRWLGHVRLNTR